MYLTLWLNHSYLSVSLMKSVVLLLELCFSLLESADCEGGKKEEEL